MNLMELLYWTFSLTEGRALSFWRLVDFTTIPEADRESGYKVSVLLILNFNEQWWYLPKLHFERCFLALNRPFTLTFSSFYIVLKFLKHWRHLLKSIIGVLPLRNHFFLRVMLELDFAQRAEVSDYLVRWPRK